MSRETIKSELLSLIAQFNAAEEPGPHPPGIQAAIDALLTLNPIPAPTSDLPRILGSWSSLYARYGMGTSKGKSERDKSDLSLQSFKAFPPVPVEVTHTMQEIGEDPPAYNNLVFFRAEGGTRGWIVVHGTWQPDAENKQRFRVVFHAAELRPMPGETAENLRAGLGLPEGAPLLRDYKPAKLWSDVVYLDEDMRVNYGGMGGVYVLARRAGPALSL